MKKLAVLLFALSLTASAHADVIQIAVAANFAAPMKQIASDFEKETGHQAMLSFGATGKFYAQIRNGAPFEVLLAADDETPTKLAKEGAALATTQFTYAKGKLALWSAKPAFVDTKGEVLKTGSFDRRALTNPRLAPYGAAAVEVMKALGVHETLSPRFVTAENLTQTYQFIKSGNAQLGFVALSQVLQDGKLVEGSAWAVPTSLHQPIRQDAIVLDKGKGKPAVEALMKYLGSDKVRALIQSYGYEL